ncbi:MAG: S1C family serine protease [Microthrixaceae bacterium]
MQPPAAGPPDDGDDEDLTAVGPAAPVERTWIHPSERAMVQRGHTDRRRSSRLAIALVLVGSGLLVAGVVLGVGRQGDEPAPSPEALARPSVATVTVVGAPGGTTTVTAVVLDGDGHLLTRATALAGATEVWARCGDRAPQRAEVVATDPTTDLAVLAVPDAGGRAVVAGSARVGDGVLEVTASGGEGDPRADRGEIVDAGVDDVTPAGTVRVDLLRVAVGDAPEGSGAAATSSTAATVAITRTAGAATGDGGDGVLFDRRGRLVGILVGPGADGDGELAVTGRDALRAARSLVESRRVERAWIGVQATDLDRPSAMARGLEGGALVVAVTAGAPAQAGGLAPGDVIVASGGEPVRRMVDLTAALRKGEPGSAVALTVVRGPDRLTLTVVPTSAP